MTEHKSKATLAREHLLESAANREPQEERERPRLQLRHDAPTLDVSETTSALDALARLRADRTEMLALRGEDGTPKAVLLPVERYLALISRELEGAPQVVSNGRIMLTDGALKAAEVEQADPTEPWDMMPPQVT